MLQLRTFSQPNDVDNNRASHVDEKSPPKTSDLGPPGLLRVSDVTQITKRVNNAVDKCRLSIRLTALGKGSIDGCFDIVDWKFIRRCDNSNRIFGLGSADSTVLHFKSFCLVSELKDFCHQQSLRSRGKDIPVIEISIYVYPW